MSGKNRKRRDARIRAEFARCGKIRETAKRLGHSVNTVRKVLRGRSGPPRPPAARPPRPGKLDPYKPLVRRLVLEDKLTAVLILEELRDMGFDGGYSIVKDFVRTVRPSPATRVTTVLDHPPGKEGQMDWSPYPVWLGGVRTVVHGFSLVLPFSRWMYLRFALDEQLETLMALHDGAFDTLGAVAALMTYDNMTTVGRHAGPDPDDVWINPRFAEYAQHYDFEVHLIDPGRPNQHASVERPFDYVENNCLRRRRFRFEDLADLNRHATWWCDEIANVRIHGTTRQRPVDRLELERPYLRPLPDHRAEVYREYERDVGRDFCVRFDNSRYSVHPRHVARRAAVRVYPARLEIWIDGRLEAAHERAVEPHQRRVLPEHEEAFKRCTPSRLLLEQAFLRLGDGAKAYHEGLRSQRGRGAGYHIQRILKLADRYGASVVAGAMAHAARYGNYSADAVGRVIAGRALPAVPAVANDAAQPPDRVRRWLEGIDVEQRELSDFDAIVERLGAPGREDGDDEA